MLVVFTNKSGGTVEMFEKVALEMIKMMGRRQAVPSAISAEDLPAALQSLQQELKALEQAAAEETEDADSTTDDEDAPKQVGISISIRAYPLIELMKHAIDNQSFLMWDYN
jgi:glucose-6-phosphate isomerase